MPNTYKLIFNPLTGNFDQVVDVVDAAQIANGSVSNAEFQTLDGVTSAIQTQLNDKVDDTEKGAANGVATLDGAGKIPVAQLPSAVMTYEGTWSAATNTPTLANGTGDQGMVYLVTAAGTVNFGAGPIVFQIGDWVVYSGTVWQQSPSGDDVLSVFGRIGVVTATAGDYTASQVTNVPAGNLSAVEVQAALNELQSDVDTRATSSALTTHTGASTGVHGVTGAVVGTTDSQTLTNKTIDADSNTITNIENADIKTGAAIARAKLASGTASHVVVNDGSGVMSSEAQLAILRGGTGLGALGAAGQFLRVNAGATALEYASTGSGDVVGPASSTDNAIARFDSTTGKAIQNSAVTVSDNGAITISGDTTASQTQLNLNSGASGTNDVIVFANANIGGQTADRAFLRWQRDNNDGRRLAAFVCTTGGVSTQAMLLDYTGSATFNSLTASTLTSTGVTTTAGVTLTGGSAANFSIWSASNVLRNRGGTSGWAIDNASGTQVFSIGNTGIHTIGPTTGNIIHQVYGRLSVANSLGALFGEMSFEGVQLVTITSVGPADFTTPSSACGLVYVTDATAGTCGVFRMDGGAMTAISNGMNGNIVVTRSSATSVRVAWNTTGSRSIKISFLYF